MDNKEIEAKIEAILFAAGEPVRASRIAQVLGVETDDIFKCAKKLSDEYSFDRRGIRLAQMGDSLQLCSAPEYAQDIVHALEKRKPPKLSQSALEVKEQHKAALWGFVQQALATFCENPENLHQPAVRKVLGDNLLMAMGAMLEEAQPMVTAESISHQSYRRLLSRAREYVLENMSEPVTVLDLCNQLHVSRRTLQNAFHAILGIGPNAWLKRIRLNAVRRELISPWSQSTTVKDAAMQWGFWHLGQFATDYQQLFAEKPSLTLHQRMREWG